ncbi:phage tail sheath family protein [Persephonella sp.]
MAQFLHGVDIQGKNAGIIPFVEVQSAIIGLVGTAPQGEPWKMHEIRNWDDAVATFGNETAGYTIHRALRNYFNYRETTVLVINVFDPTVHTDVSAVSATDIVNGLNIFKQAKQELGFFPKILDVPNFSQDITVAQAMSSLADQIRAIALVNAPEGADITTAVNFKNNFSSKRVYVFYPKVYTLDALTGKPTLDWLSSVAAGLIVKTDYEKGFQNSPSNKELKGVLGLEFIYEYIPDDPTSEVQYLNSQGIITVKKDRAGYRLFGNTSSAYPANTHPADIFINWVRVADILDETIQDNLIQTLDENIIDNPYDPTTSIVYRVRESIDDLLNTWKAKGIIISGQAEVPLDLNTASELALGNVHYRIHNFAVSTPMQGITIERVANSNALAEVFSKLFGGNQ